MSKSTIINSPRTGPPRLPAENVVGFAIILTILASVFVGYAGQVVIASIMFVGAVIAYAAVIAARNAR